MGKIELPTDIISIIEDYANEFEEAEMLEYAMQKIISRLDRGTGFNIYLWSVKSEIKRVERELRTIWSKEKTNTKARLKARIRPVTYKRHLRFERKDKVCTKRMYLLSHTILKLQKDYSQWDEFNDMFKETMVYKRCIEVFGELRESQTIYCRLTGAYRYFKTKQCEDNQIDKKSLFRM